MPPGGDDAKATVERFDEAGSIRLQLGENGADRRGRCGDELHLGGSELRCEGAGAESLEHPVDCLLWHERRRVDEDELLLHSDRGAAARMETLAERLLELLGRSHPWLFDAARLARQRLPPEARQPPSSPKHPGVPPLVAVPPIAAAQT